MIGAKVGELASETYRAETAAAALGQLNSFEAQWGKLYPAIGQAWLAAWEALSPQRAEGSKRRNGSTYIGIRTFPGIAPRKHQFRGSAALHQARSRSRRYGDSITHQPLQPRASARGWLLACSTRMTIPVLLMSSTLSEVISEAAQSRSDPQLSHSDHCLYSYTLDSGVRLWGGPALRPFRSAPSARRQVRQPSTHADHC
jgi:hypothetical protein